MREKKNNKTTDEKESPNVCPDKLSYDSETTTTTITPEPVTSDPECDGTKKKRNDVMKDDGEIENEPCASVGEVKEVIDITDEDDDEEIEFIEPPVPASNSKTVEDKTSIQDKQKKNNGFNIDLDLPSSFFGNSTASPSSAQSNGKFFTPYRLI